MWTMDTPETPKPASRFFWKLDLNKFVNIWYREKRAKSEVEPQIEISEFKQLNVLAYLLHEIRPSDNTLAATYQEIADKTGESIGRKPRQAPQRISDINQESYEPGKE